MNGDLEFGRHTVIAAVASIENWRHADIDRLLLEYALEGTSADRGNSRTDRANEIIRYLMENPGATAPDGSILTNALVRDLVNRAIDRAGEPSELNPDPFQDLYPDLDRALRRDGYVVEGTSLRRVAPEPFDVHEIEDEIHSLLGDHGFQVAAGHLDQALESHTAGRWAAANGQLRAFLDALFESVASLVADEGVELPEATYGQIRFLADCDPPILYRDLNEWIDGGTGYVQGLRRRLHPEGPHPGLSDEEDSTLRLYLVLVTARAILRRI